MAEATDFDRGSGPAGRAIRNARFQSAIGCVFSANIVVLQAKMNAQACLLASFMQDEAAEIVRGLRSRDPELLDRLIESYQYRLFRYLMVLTGNPALAEDLFQQTWLRVLERGHQYNGQWKFEAWLFSIARHLVIDHSRHKRATSLDALVDPEDGSVPFQPASTDPSPFEVLASSENGQHLSVALRRVPAVYREVLLLRFQEELQLEEIARLLGTPLSTVKSRLYRGLEVMRKLMEEAGV